MQPIEKSQIFYSNAEPASTATFGLTNGGTAGAIYIYIFTFGFGMAIVSMAEMASMYDIASMA
jgi:hypothetical protein